MARFVFDINALISAFLIEESIPGHALRSALNQGVVLVSVPLVTTLAGVLRRPSLDRYLTLHEREELVAAFVAGSRMVETTERIRACRDPDDDAILELAVNGNAATIITGDSDLLVLNPFRPVFRAPPSRGSHPPRGLIGSALCIAILGGCEASRPPTGPDAASPARMDPPPPPPPLGTGPEPCVGGRADE